MKIISLEGLFLVFNILTTLRCTHDLVEHQETFQEQGNNNNVSETTTTMSSISHSEIRINTDNVTTTPSTVPVDQTIPDLNSTILKDGFIDYLKNIENADSWSRRGYDQLKQFQKLDFMMFKNSCEKVSSSCEASCGTFATQNKDVALITQSCSCDALCTVFDDCCQDFEEYCPEQLEYYQLYFTYLLGTPTSCSNSGYAVLSGCPPNSSTTMQITASEYNSSIRDTFLFTDTDTGIQYLNYSILRCHNVQESRATPWTKSIFPNNDDDQFRNDMSGVAVSVLENKLDYIDIPPVTGYVPRLCNYVDLRCSCDDSPCKRASLETKDYAYLCTNLEDYFRSNIIDTDRFCSISKMDTGSRNNFATLMTLETNSKLVLYNQDFRTGWTSLSCHVDIQSDIQCDQKQCPRGKVLVNHDDSEYQEACMWTSFIIVSFPMDELDFVSGIVLLDTIDLGLTSFKNLDLRPVETKIVTIKESLVKIMLYQIKENLLSEKNTKDLTITKLVKEQLKGGDHKFPEWIEVCYTSGDFYEPKMTKMDPNDDGQLKWRVCNKFKREDLLQRYQTNERATGINYQLSFITVIIVVFSDILLFYAI